jgi:hypothetical protein
MAKPMTPPRAGQAGEWIPKDAWVEENRGLVQDVEEVGAEESADGDDQAAVSSGFRIKPQSVDATEEAVVRDDGTGEDEREEDAERMVPDADRGNLDVGYPPCLSSADEP